MHDTELELQSARDRITRLEGKEASLKKAHDDLKTKIDEAVDAFADLKEMKVATFNHFWGKLETVNENKQGEDISDLKNVIPLALRNYVSKEIERGKDSLQ